MPTNIPTDLLRTLVAIVDTGSISRATERVFRSQSALSLQMRRLEELTQSPLFRREGRNLALTQSGETLVQHAREMLRINDRAIAALTEGAAMSSIRVGLAQDFAETLLPTILKKFTIHNPKIPVHVHVGKSRELDELFENDQFDLVLGVAQPENRATVAIDDLIWLGDDRLLHGAVIPLAVMDSPCVCRDAAIAALDSAGVSYRIVVETPSLSVLSGAVKSGLAVTCRPGIYASNDMLSFQIDYLPLPKISYILRTTAPISTHTERLMTWIKATLRTHRSLPPREPATLAGSTVRVWTGGSPMEPTFNSWACS